MEDNSSMDKKAFSSQQESGVRKGPWTMEEDLTLINYISIHGEGVWNNLAQSAGLMRTGKSCRLRWLNYLRPGIRRGNITPEEKLLIMDLQSRWGNRWSKIARQMPGRTDNEIKNYWRTRVQKKEAVVVMKQSGNIEATGVVGEDDDGNNYDQKSSVLMMMDIEGSSTSQTDGSCIDEGISIRCSPVYVDVHHQGISPDDDAFLPNPSSAATQSSDGLWGVDDLWSMQ